MNIPPAPLEPPSPPPDERSDAKPNVTLAKPPSLSLFPSPELARPSKPSSLADITNLQLESKANAEKFTARQSLKKQPSNGQILRTPLPRQPLGRAESTPLRSSAITNNDYSKSQASLTVAHTVPLEGVVRTERPMTGYSSRLSMSGPPAVPRKKPRDENGAIPSSVLRQARETWFLKDVTAKIVEYTDNEVRSDFACGPPLPSCTPNKANRPVLSELSTNTVTRATTMVPKANQPEKTITGGSTIKVYEDASSTIIATSRNEQLSTVDSPTAETSSNRSSGHSQGKDSLWNVSTGDTTVSKGSQKLELSFNEFIIDDHNKNRVSVTTSSSRTSSFGPSGSKLSRTNSAGLVGNIVVLDEHSDKLRQRWEEEQRILMAPFMDMDLEEGKVVVKKMLRPQNSFFTLRNRASSNAGAEATTKATKKSVFIDMGVETWEVSNTWLRAQVDPLGPNDAIRLHKDHSSIKYLKLEGETYEVVSGTLDCLVRELINPIYHHDDKNRVITSVIAKAIVAAEESAFQYINVLVNMYAEATLEQAERITDVLARIIGFFGLMFERTNLGTVMARAIDLAESLPYAETKTQLFYALSNMCRTTMQAAEVQKVLFGLVNSSDIGEPFKPYDIQRMIKEFRQNPNDVFYMYEYLMASDVKSIAEYFTTVDFYMFIDATTVQAFAEHICKHNEIRGEPNPWRPLYKNGDVTNDYVCRILRRFSLTKNMFHCGLLLLTTAEQRAAHITKLINIAAELLKLGDYHTAGAIAEALACKDLHEDKSWEMVWKKLPKGDQFRYRQIHSIHFGLKIMKNSSSFKEFFKNEKESEEFTIVTNDEIIPRFSKFYYDVMSRVDKAFDLSDPQLETSFDPNIKPKLITPAPVINTAAFEECFLIVQRQHAKLESKYTGGRGLDIIGKLRFNSLIFRQHPPNVLSAEKIFYDHSAKERTVQANDFKSKWLINKERAQGPLSELCLHIEGLMLALWCDNNCVTDDFPDKVRDPLQFWPELPTFPRLERKPMPHQRAVSNPQRK